MSEIPTPPLWRQRLDRVMQRLPADTPEWAKVMMDLTLELAVSQINHTDNNTRSALQEQDERLKDTITATKDELLEQLGTVEQAVHLHDNAFTVLEGLLEQNTAILTQLARRVRVLSWALAAVMLLVIGETIVYLARAILLPSDLLWIGGTGLVIGALVAGGLWLTRRPPGKEDEPAEPSEPA